MFLFKTRSTFNFNNGVHEQRKALNQSKRFVINQKTVFTSQNEGFVEKYDFS